MKKYANKYKILQNDPNVKNSKAFFGQDFWPTIGKIHNIFGMNEDIMMSTTIGIEAIAKS